MLLIASLILTEGCGMGSAQTAKGKVDGTVKVAVELRNLYDEYSTYVVSHQAGVFRPSSRLVRAIDDRVVIDAVAAGDAEILKSDLESLGMRQAVVFGRVVSGELPIAAIPAMGALRSLNFARAATALLQGGAR
jgi:hypothetical protein